MSLPLSLVVVEEIRAGLARRRMKQADFAKALGISQPTLSRRLAGESPFDLEEVEAAARILDLPLASLLLGSSAAVA